MRICAALMFFNEATDDLAAAIESVAPLADRLVMVDGRWQGFGEGDPASPLGQVEALAEMAGSVGLDFTLHRPVREWPGEVSHRNYVLRLALADADWIYLLDADERVTKVGGDTRERLAETDRDVATVRFHTPRGWHPTATGWEQPGKTSEQRRVFRASPDLRIENWHWHLRNDRHALWGVMPGLPFAPAKDLDVNVSHLTCQRTEERWAWKDEHRPGRDRADKRRGYEL